jgi:hypothetical protein
MWEPQSLATLRASTACYRDSFTFLLVIAMSFWNPIVTVASIPVIYMAAIPEQPKAEMYCYGTWRDFNDVACLVGPRVAQLVSCLGYGLDD